MRSRELSGTEERYRYISTVSPKLAILRSMEATLVKLDPESDQWLYELGEEQCDLLFAEIRELLRIRAEFGIQDCSKCSDAACEYCHRDLLTNRGRPALCHTHG